MKLLTNTMKIINLEKIFICLTRLFIFGKYVKKKHIFKVSFEINRKLI